MFHFFSILLNEIVADASPTTIFDYIQSGGIVAIVLVIIYGGYKKEPWWVFGWLYRDRVKECDDRIQRQEADSADRLKRLRIERDEWKGLALRSTNLAESLNEVARQHTRDFPSSE